MGLSNIAKRRHSLLFNAVDRKNITHLEITTNNLGASSFDIIIWRKLYNLIHYNKDFKRLHFIIPHDKAGEFFDKIDFHMKKEKDFHKMLDSLYKEEDIVCDDYRKKVTYTIDSFLDQENEGGNWNFLQVSITDKSGVTELHGIQ